MLSQTRIVINGVMEKYASDLMCNGKNWDILEIGIDGDKPPSGSYEFFGQGNNWQTMDFLERTKADFIVDITKPRQIPDLKWDLVICIQTLEHIYKVHKAIKNIAKMTKQGGYAILDNPWMNQYHGQAEYGDFWRMSLPCMEKLCEDVGMEKIDGIQHEHYVSILARKL